MGNVGMKRYRTAPAGAIALIMLGLLAGCTPLRERSVMGLTKRDGTVVIALNRCGYLTVSTIAIETGDGDAWRIDRGEAHAVNDVIAFEVPDGWQNTDDDFTALGAGVDYRLTGRAAGDPASAIVFTSTSLDRLGPDEVLVAGQRGKPKVVNLTAFQSAQCVL